MSKNENEPKSDKSIRKDVIGCIGLVAAALITGLCGPGVLRFFDRTPTPSTTPTVAAPTVAAPTVAVTQEQRLSDSEIPIVFYATFGVEFAEGAWKEGETYDYRLQVQECGSDNFKGQTISFSVSEFWDQPFFLLKDGLYDNYDKNYAQLAQASSFQQSYAIVLLSKDTIEEAERILNSCRASIIINSGPPRPMEPYYRGAAPLASDGTLDIDTASFMDIVP